MGTNKNIEQNCVVLHPNDNLVVSSHAIPKNNLVIVGNLSFMANDDIPVGHKIASKNIAKGEKVLKYGSPIGSASSHIAIGDHMHLHNIKSDYIKSTNRENF